TAMRQAEALQNGPENPSVLKDMAYGAVIGSQGGPSTAAAGAGAGLLRNIAVRVQNAIGGRANPQVIRKTVDMLTTIDPRLQNKVLSEIQRQLARVPKNRQTEKTIERILSGVLISAGVR